MTLRETIEAAFAGRQMPAQVIPPGSYCQCDSDAQETLWFTGRDWRQVSWKDWEEHRHAIHFFSPEAFAYYLPSLLLAALQKPQEWLYAAETVLISLDLSPSTEGWSEHFRARFLQLRREELEVLKEWLLALCGYSTYRGHGLAASGPGETFARAFDTVDLLQRQRLGPSAGGNGESCGDSRG